MPLDHELRKTLREAERNLQDIRNELALAESDVKPGDTIVFGKKDFASRYRGKVLTVNYSNMSDKTGGRHELTVRTLKRDGTEGEQIRTLSPFWDTWEIE